VCKPVSIIVDDAPSAMLNRVRSVNSVGRRRIGAVCEDSAGNSDCYRGSAKLGLGTKPEMVWVNPRNDPTLRDRLLHQDVGARALRVQLALTAETLGARAGKPLMLFHQLEQFAAVAKEAFRAGARLLCVSSRHFGGRSPSESAN
jgi:hypothetical protein